MAKDFPRNFFKWMKKKKIRTEVMKRAKWYCINRALLVAHQMWLQWSVHRRDVVSSRAYSVITRNNIHFNDNSIVSQSRENGFVSCFTPLVFYGNSTISSGIDPATYHLYPETRPTRELQKAQDILLTIYTSLIKFFCDFHSVLEMMAF